MNRYASVLILLLGIHCAVWGQQWHASTGDFLHAVYPLDSMRLWGIRQANTSLADLRCVYSADGGHTWEDRGIFPQISGVYDSKIQALDDQHLWFSITSSQGGLFKRTVNGGQSWQNFNLPYGTYAWRFGNTQQGFAIVDNQQTGQPFQLYRTSDGGDTWALQSSNPFADLEPYDYLSATYEREGIFWMHTFKGRIYKTSDNGLSWHWVGSVPEAAVYGSNLAFENENTGILLNRLSGAGALLRKTTDGGQTWQLLQENGLPLTDMNTIRTVVPVPGKPNHWVAGTLRGTAWSADGGVTWTRANTATKFDFWKIVFTSSTHAYGLNSWNNYHQEWSGPFDVHPCITFLSPLQSRVERNCSLMTVLSARVEISGDTSVQVGWWYRYPDGVLGGPQFVPNLKESEVAEVHFTPEPGTPYIGTLTVKTHFYEFFGLDSTEAINRYQLFPTACEMDTTPVIAVRPGIFYQLFHRNCFNIETDTANCSVHLNTNVCGYDTAHYTIRYWFPNLQEPYPYVNTGDTFTAPHTPINELITFFVIRDAEVFATEYYCFDTLQVHLICGVSDAPDLVLQHADWHISPSPAKDWFSVSHPEHSKIALLTVCDLAGQKRLVQEIDRAAVIETASWPQGVYLLHLQDTRTGQTSVKKLAVAH